MKKTFLAMLALMLTGGMWAQETISLPQPDVTMDWYLTPNV